MLSQNHGYKNETKCVLHCASIYLNVIQNWTKMFLKPNRIFQGLIYLKMTVAGNMGKQEGRCLWWDKWHAQGRIRPGSISWSRDAAESLRHGLRPVGPQESSSTLQSLLRALSLRWRGLRSPFAEHQCHHPSLENTGTTLIQATGWKPRGITPGQLSSVRGCLGWAKGHQLVLKCRPVNRCGLGCIHPSSPQECPLWFCSNISLGGYRAGLKG